jgi:Cu2+-exporting ATPase
MFRRRFWLSLAATIPLVVTSEMVMDWFGYELDFPGRSWLGPLLGSFVFWWGGWPFLKGGFDEIRDRQPGMMLLISMAITVAYGASMASGLGGSTSTSGGSWPHWSRSCSSATGRR